jgi:hypothetical protein
LLSLCLLAGSASLGHASATPGSREHPCRVGGPPAWHFTRVLGVKQLSPVVTIACGRRLVGPYEIVAVDTSEGLWVFADSGPDGFSEGQAIRNPKLDLQEPAITFSQGWGGPPARSRVSGVLAANVTRVEVIFHHRGQHRRLVRAATTARVSGDLLRVLHQTEPFGAYALTMSGCVVPKGVRVVAFDAQGRRVGTARGRNFIPHPCNPKTWF